MWNTTIKHLSATVVLASACATGRVYNTSIGPLTVVANCDKECYLANRAAFIKQLQEVQKRNDDEMKPNARKYSSWSASGILVGLAGGLAGLILPHDNDRKNVATGASLTGAAITSWLTTKRYEARAASADACVTAAAAAITNFQATWDETNLPPATDEQKGKYGQFKSTISSQLGKICPR